MKKVLQFDLFWLGLGLSFMFLLFGHDHPLLNPDETRYSEIARELLATHDFITPRLNGVIFFDKPILYYWLQAFSLFCFGVNEWALRLFPALFGVIGCLSMYLAGHCLFDRKTGIYSALLLASTPLYFLASHYANMDLEVAVLINACLMSFIIGMQDRFIKQRPLLLYLAYSLAALAILTKGLIGIVFPFMIIGSWILLTKQWSLIRTMRLPTGLLLIALLVSPWFYLVQKANPNFYHYFFMIQHVERFLASDFNGQSPIWFYIPIIMLGTFPWMFLIIPGFYQGITRIKESPILLYFVLWIFLIFTFFSIPTSKLIGYILPVVPPLMLLAARYLALNDEQASKGLIRGLLSAQLLLAGILFYVPQLPMFEHAAMLKPCILLATTVLVSGLCMTYCHFFKSKRITWYTVIAMSTANLLMLSLIIPMLPIPSHKTLIHQVQSIMQPDDEIVNYFYYFYDTPLYMQKNITLVAHWGSPEVIRRDSWRGIFSYGLDYNPKNPEQYIRPEALWARWNKPKRLFVFTRKQHLTQFKAHADPVIIIAENDAYLVISNQE